VDKLRMDTNGSLLILCTDTVGKNTTTGRILQVIKGKDYGMPVRRGWFLKTWWITVMNYNKQS